MSAHVAARAMHCLGTPFRLYGRTPGVALDCVGLAGFAAALPDLPRDYSMRGEFRKSITTYIENKGCIFSPNTCFLAGDIALVNCGPRQQHVMVAAQDGWVHAHAGLGHVVHMAGACPWPVIAAWRIIGE